MVRGSVVPSLEEIITQTLGAIENSKTQIFDIAEIAHNESERIKIKLAKLQEQVIQVIEQLDNLEKMDKKARLRLMEVSRDIKRYNEEDIRKAYEGASNVQAEVKILRNKEERLRQERTELERQYMRNRETVNKAQQLVSQVGVVLDYLSGNMQGINDKLEEIEARGSLGSRIINAQEEERRRVAREIHDGPAQSMANIVLRAEFCERLIDKDVLQAKEELKLFKDLVRNNLKDVRKIIYDLRPMVLDDLGLIPALIRYVEDFKARFNIKVDLLTSGNDIRLPNTLEVGVFRVIQEALQNVQKHAHATKVIVQLEITEKTVKVIVEDNGKGFVLSEVLSDKDREGYGLLSMRERVELLRGQIDFNSHPHIGTVITINIPLQNSNMEV